VGTIALLGIATIMVSVTGNQTRLVWNGSASAPIGLYWVQHQDRIARGDLVLAELPATVREVAAVRRYLPPNVPLVKRVAALSGDTVCAIDATISINDEAVAQRLDRDLAGRPMPVWRGCRILGRGDVFLLMADVPASFDGRYFGVTRTNAIQGRLVTLWTP
jgi:conjugative transfer signal peptidase TraF